MSDFLETLREKYGSRPFKATDVIRDVSADRYPPALERVMETGRRPSLSMGHFLAKCEGVQTIPQAPGDKHGKLYRLDVP